MRTRRDNGDHIISIVPIEVCLDHRLTLTQIRVLVALFSFRNKDTGVSRVKRSTLAERCGYPETRISTATTELVKLGWILKEGKGGFSQPASYQVTTPDLSTVTKHVTVQEGATVTEPVTVTTSVTVTEPVTTTVTEPVTPTVTEPVTRIKGIELSNEQSKEQSRRGPPSADTTIGGVKTESSSAAFESKKRTPHTIPMNWLPDARCWDLLLEAGIPQEFAEKLIGEFRLYWDERGDKRPGWNATFINHVKAQWSREQDRPKSRYITKTTEPGWMAGGI